MNEPKGQKGDTDEELYRAYASRVRILAWRSLEYPAGPIDEYSSPETVSLEVEKLLKAGCHIILLLAPFLPESHKP